MPSRFIADPLNPTVPLSTWLGGRARLPARFASITLANPVFS